MKRLSLWVFFCLMISGCSGTLEKRAQEAVIADTATTVVGLNAGLVESNHLINTSPISLLAVTMAKLALVDYVAEDTSEQGKTNLRILTGVWGAASVNNLMAIAGASGPLAIVIGIISGIIFYNQPESAESVDE